MNDAATELPRALHDAAGSRALDRAAMQVDGITGIELMRRAGAAAFDILRQRWPDARRVRVVCGAGNNGGDGFVVARLASEAGLQVSVALLGDPTRLRGDAALAFEDWRGAGGELDATPLHGLAVNVDVAVDALFGTGLDRALHGRALEAVETLNRTRVPVLALDMPSGLHADSGAVMGAAVQADATVSFISLKPGTLTGEGPSHCGRVHFASLGVPQAVLDAVRPVAVRTDLERCRGWLARRTRSAHKGHFGHVLVVGGEHGHGGAVRLAAEAAARSGAGLVSVATRERHVAALLAGRPELMVHAIAEAAELDPLLAQASVIAIGPGLGQSAWGRAMLEKVLAADECPMVLDADALNLLAGRELRRSHWVLTPHPGEAGRLLGSDGATVQQDRFAAASGVLARYGGCVVLKGAGTLIADDQGVPRLCSEGNPGMATGGMGDVLCGVIAALLAQGLPPSRAAELGVAVHARAADRATADGERGLLASDLFAPMRLLLNPP